MSLAYVDTSCLLAVAFAEPGWERHAARLERPDRLLSSNLLEAEFRSALNREGVDDDSLLERIGWIHPDRSLEPEYAGILQHGYLRGADLWHVACALYTRHKAGTLTFLTADDRQGEVAAVVDLSPGV